MNDNYLNILSIVRETIKSNNMINDNSPIILGVSGGPDSMALLDIFSKLYPDQLIVFHLNHKFRGKEAVEDAEFVKSESEKRGLPIELEEFDVPAFMSETGLGAQEAARTIRYSSLLKVAKKWNAKYIALGHHANDQEETILMRLIRGTGVHGLSGIPYTRNFNGIKIIRPLLDITRNDIEKYCADNSISYRLDKSNLSTKYFRNEIRLNVIPYLKKYNNNLTLHINHLGKIIQDENNYLNKIAEQFLLEKIIEKNERYFIFNVRELQNLDIALQRRVIHLILRYLNLKQEPTYTHIEKIVKLIHHSHPSKSLDLSGIKIYRNYEEIVFALEENNKEKQFSFLLSIPDEKIFNSNKIKTIISDEYLKLNGQWAVFDFDKLNNKELIVRSRENGDRIDLYGMKGSKKLKDLFIDQKIPRGERDLYPIIEHNNKILWVPGVKRSRHYLISNETRNFLYITVEKI